MVAILTGKRGIIPVKGHWAMAAEALIDACDKFVKSKRFSEVRSLHTSLARVIAWPP